MWKLTRDLGFTLIKWCQGSTSMSTGDQLSKCKKWRCSCNDWDWEWNKVVIREKPLTSIKRRMMFWWLNMLDLDIGKSGIKRSAKVKNYTTCIILLALVPASMVGKSWSDLYSNRLGQAWLRLKNWIKYISRTKLMSNLNNMRSRWMRLLSLNCKSWKTWSKFWSWWFYWDCINLRFVSIFNQIISGHVSGVLLAY